MFNTVNTSQVVICSCTCKLSSGSITWRENLDACLLIYSDQEHNLCLQRRSSFVNRALGADVFFNQSDLLFNDMLQLQECQYQSIVIHRPALVDSNHKERYQRVLVLKGFRHVELSCHWRRGVGSQRGKAARLPTCVRQDAVPCSVGWKKWKAVTLWSLSLLVYIHYLTDYSLFSGKLYFITLYLFL